MSIRLPDMMELASHNKAASQDKSVSSKDDDASHNGTA